MYVFIGEHIALVDFITCMNKRNLLDHGDYIVISVDDEAYNPQTNIQLQKGKFALE